MQTFTFEGDPDGVALETLWFEDLGDGRTRLRTQSLVDSFESRDAWLRSGMETGVDEGYGKLDRCSPMVLSDRPAERHRQVAGLFTEWVCGTRSWDAPSPVPGWAARDVVRHLAEWFPGFLAAGACIDLPRGPSVDDNPVAAWQVHRDGVQAVLDHPETAHRELANPHIGRLPWWRRSTNSTPPTC